jgi:hypothetical protein
MEGEWNVNSVATSSSEIISLLITGSKNMKSKAGKTKVILWWGQLLFRKDTKDKTQYAVS